MKCKMLQAAVLALAMFFPLSTIWAQETRTVSLQEAIDLSVKNSKQLKAGRARVDQATAAYTQAVQNQLPDLKVSGSYLRVLQPNVDLKVKLNNNNNGGSNGGNNQSNDIKVNQAAYGIANLSLPLFSGFRIKYGIESAKLLQKAASLDVDNDRDEVVLNTISSYANLYKARASVALLRENLSQSQQRDTDFANLERNGLLARNDLLKSELQTSNIEYNLVDAENNAEVANVNMDILLGLPENTKLLLDSASLLQPPSVQELDMYEQQALQHRTDLQALNLRTQAASTAIKSAKSEYYPGIAFTGGYVALDVPNFVTITNAITFGVGVQYNLGSLWKTNAKVEEAKARQREYAANVEALNDNIRLQVNSAYQNYLSSIKKIELTNKSIAQAEENYKITKNKYDNSLVTLTDLLDANVALLQARISQQTARADAVVAYNTLLQRAGALAPQSTTTPANSGK